MTLSEAAKITRGRCTGEATFRGVSTDTRVIAPGNLFVALRGERFDGHEFIARAMAGGATGALGEALPEEVAGVVVDDSLAALGRLAAAHRTTFRGPVIAVTGSVGKTTTKEMLRAVLASRLSGTCSPASFNNNIGVPLTILAAAANDDFTISEMGTSGPGEIRALCEIARPEMAVVLRVGPTHLAGLGSVEGVARAKAEILEGLDGTAFLNADDPAVFAMRKLCSGEVVTFGLSPEADVRATSPGRSEAGIAFTVEEIGRVEMTIPGLHHLTNALAAIAVGRAFGLAGEEIRRALVSCAMPKMRMRLEVAGGVTVIDDTYNANPLSLAAAIDELAARRAARRILVVGAMGELGEASGALHREAGERAGRAGIDLVVCVGDCAPLGEAAAAAGLAVATVEDPSAAAAVLAGEVAPGDCVLLKASRSCGLDEAARAFLEDLRGRADRC